MKIALSRVILLLFVFSLFNCAPAPNEQAEQQAKAEHVKNFESTSDAGERKSDMPCAPGSIYCGHKDLQAVCCDDTTESCRHDKSVCLKKCRAGEDRCGTDCCYSNYDCKWYITKKAEQVNCCTPPNFKPCGSCTNLCNEQYEICTPNRRCICRGCEECEESTTGFCNPGQKCTHSKAKPCCASDAPVACGTKCCPYGNKCDTKYTACVCPGCSLCPSVNKTSYTICDASQECGTKSGACMTRGSDDCGNGLVCPPNFTCTNAVTKPCCPTATPTPCTNDCCSANEECQSVNKKKVCVTKGWTTCATSASTHVLCTPGEKCSKMLKKCIDKSNKDCGTHTCKYDQVCAKAPLLCCDATAPRPCPDMNKCCPHSSSCGSFGCIPSGYTECISGDGKIHALCNQLQTCCSFANKALCVPKGATCKQIGNQYCYCQPPNPLIVDTHLGPTCWPSKVEHCQASYGRDGYCPSGTECRSQCICSTCKNVHSFGSYCCSPNSAKLNCPGKSPTGCVNPIDVQFGFKANCIK
ncbi:hypothetical protein KKH43_06855 [Patescibacteria group bacterium]|nr:hypothetical protein [Patescibacteria group bacterium]